VINQKLEPFVKWAGGKRQLLSKITASMPKNFNSYYEPFVGGGALFMRLCHKRTIISDISYELVLSYLVILNDLEILMSRLDQHEIEHLKNPMEYYYEVRSLDKDPGLSNLSDVEVAARFIYLNKACFNGLYRVNNKGFFNVPSGKKERIKTHDKSNLKKLSQYFRESVEIRQGDFESSCYDVAPGDFVFFDPPYDLLNETTFEKYNVNSFGKEGQIRLANFAKDLDKKGVYFMVTNHNTPLINELYKDFNIEVVQVKRMINSDSSNRVGEEVIITNYEVNR
jgi:DNA adenine methylase